MHTYMGRLGNKRHNISGVRCISKLLQQQQIIIANRKKGNDPCKKSNCLPSVKHKTLYNILTDQREKDYISL